MRDLNSPQYKKWRSSVFRRDNYTCKLCGCKKGIEAHHIVRWVDCEKLRYVVSNGITLCSFPDGNGCHDRVTGNEKAWEQKLKSLIPKCYNKGYLMVMKWLRTRQK